MAGYKPHGSLPVFDHIKYAYGVDMFGENTEITKPFVLFGHLITQSVVEKLLAQVVGSEETPDLFAGNDSQKKGKLTR